MKRKLQKADIIKTHGSNAKLRKYIGKLSVTKTNYAIDKTINWYKDTYFKYKN